MYMVTACESVYLLQAVQYSLVGKRAEAVKKITSAIETDPTMAEFHMLRWVGHKERTVEFQPGFEPRAFLLPIEPLGLWH